MLESLSAEHCSKGGKRKKKKKKMTQADKEAVIVAAGKNAIVVAVAKAGAKDAAKKKTAKEKAVAKKKTKGSAKKKTAKGSAKKKTKKKKKQLGGVHTAPVKVPPPVTPWGVSCCCFLFYERCFVDTWVLTAFIICIFRSGNP